MTSCGWDFRISCGSIIQNWVNHYSFAITMLVVIILNVSWCWKNMLKAVAKSYDCSISKKRKEKIKNYCSIFDKWANQRLWQPSHSIAPTGLFTQSFHQSFPNQLFSQILNSRKSKFLKFWNIQLHSTIWAEPKLVLALTYWFQCIAQELSLTRMTLEASEHDMNTFCYEHSILILAFKKLVVSKVNAKSKFLFPYSPLIQ